MVRPTPRDLTWGRLTTAGLLLVLVLLLPGPVRPTQKGLKRLTHSLKTLKCRNGTVVL